MHRGVWLLGLVLPGQIAAVALVGLLGLGLLGAVSLAGLPPKQARAAGQAVVCGIDRLILSGVGLVFIPVVILLISGLLKGAD